MLKVNSFAKHIYTLVVIAALLNICLFPSLSSYANTGVQKYYYDRQGRLAYSISPSEKMTVYTHDVNGNMIEKHAVTSTNPSKTFDRTNQIVIPGLAVNTVTGGKNTVQFWMYWDGTDNIMPFGWNNGHDLWFSDGWFGFNSGASDLLGIPSTNLTNTWIQVTAVFSNGVVNGSNCALYINGVKQTLTQALGTPTESRVASSSAYLSGWGMDAGYRFSGKLADLRIWNRELTPQEIKTNIYQPLTGSESGLLGEWLVEDQPITSMSFNGTNQITTPGLVVDTAVGGKNTVQFWMYWDGTNQIMPFGWDNKYDLLLSNGYFGFNTGENNILGIPSTNLLNKWVHVSAVFNNGVPDTSNCSLFIDGVKQTLQAVGTTTFSKTASSNANLSGWSADTGYRFSGKLADLRIWNRELTLQEVQSSIFKKLIGNETGLLGEWLVSDQPVSSMAFNGTKQISYPGLAVNTTANGKNTVQFWMYWDGTNQIMPFGWDNKYDLLLSNGYFGFNTGENNILGIPSTNLLNKWVHVSAVFNNGVPDTSNCSLFIDGVKQTLQAVGTTTFSKTASSNAYLSGWSADTGYRFSGKLADLRIWNRELTPQEVQASIYKKLSGNESGLIGEWMVTDSF